MCKNPSSVWVNRNRYHLASSKRNFFQQGRKGKLLRVEGESVRTPWQKMGPAYRGLHPGTTKFGRDVSHPSSQLVSDVSHFCSLLHIYLICRQLFLHLGAHLVMVCLFLHDLPLHESSRQIRVLVSPFQLLGETSCLDWRKQALSSPRVQIAVPRRDEGPIYKPCAVGTFWRKGLAGWAVTLEFVYCSKRLLNRFLFLKHYKFL